MDFECRKGFPFELWEDNVITACHKRGCGELAAGLYRPVAEVKKRREQLENESHKGARQCYRCKHHGSAGTCGIEIDGCARNGEEWAYTKTYGLRHTCHLGLV